MMDTIPDQQREEVSRAKLNLETSRIAWKELQRFFAAGNVLYVSAELDLVEVAFQMSEDNVAQIGQWAAAGQIGKLSDEQARDWYDTDADVWAVVVRPYVLVQAMDSLH